MASVTDFDVMRGVAEAGPQERVALLIANSAEALGFQSAQDRVMVLAFLRTHARLFRLSDRAFGPEGEVPR